MTTFCKKHPILIALIIMALYVLLMTPLYSQRLDPDWCLACRDTREHLVGGAGVQIATLLVLPRARTWQRLAVTGTIAAAFELGQAEATERSGPGYGFGVKDLLAGVAGAALVELVHSKFKL